MNDSDMIPLSYAEECSDPPNPNPHPIHTPHGRLAPSPIHTPHGPFGMFRPRHPSSYYDPYYYDYPYYPYPYQGYEVQTTIDDENLIRNLKKAINGEYSAIICYRLLAKQAKSDADRKRIEEIRKDEEKHLAEFKHIYFRLTGKKATPKQSEPCAKTYLQGLQLAFEDEQETVDFYNEIADKAHDKLVKQAFRRAALDEQNHAVWFLRFLTK